MPRTLQGRLLSVAVAALVVGVTALRSDCQAGDLRGAYLEARTCQVYTGPCFANAEVSLTGKDAIMAWSIDSGHHAGVDVSGLNVVLVTRADATLGFKGVNDAQQLKSVVLVDERANAAQRDALVGFARRQAGKAGETVVRVEATPIKMTLDLQTLTGSVVAGREVKLATRKAKPSDCICTNEVAYYPPLTRLENFVAGVSTEAEFKGRGLGTRWSVPNSRSAYMGVFAE